MTEKKSKRKPKEAKPFLKKINFEKNILELTKVQSVQGAYQTNEQNFIKENYTNGILEQRINYNKLEKTKDQIAWTYILIENYVQKYTTTIKKISRQIKENLPDINWDYLKETINDKYQQTKNKTVKYLKKYKLIKTAITIRLATVQDLDGICKVEEESFHPDDQYSESTFRKRIEGDYSEASDRKYFVAEENGTILGYGEVAIKKAESVLGSEISKVEKTLLKLDERVGVLISSGVLVKRRKEGIGMMITKARLDYLQEKYVNQVFAQAWPNGGFPYLAKKLGFKKIPKWKGRGFSDGTQQELYFKYLEHEEMARK